ncbi:hypothetical protein HRF87_25920 [Bacillus sp. CRN 9]|nr:hypothetical protein [Bacillus sp. CRN 9]
MIRAIESRHGNCWDNAPQESFFADFKDETNIEKCVTLEREIRTMAFKKAAACKVQTAASASCLAFFKMSLQMVQFMKVAAFFISQSNYLYVYFFNN